MQTTTFVSIDYDTLFENRLHRLMTLRTLALDQSNTKFNVS